MKKEINNFWHSFSLNQKNLLYAKSINDIRLQNEIFCVLERKILKIHPKLDVIISFDNNETDSQKLIFITKGKPVLRKIAEQLLEEAPSFPQWQLQSGVKPYKHSIISLCAYNRFLGKKNNIYQIYFAVKKIYKTSNKLHLLLYLEMDKQLSKSDLHELMHLILIYFLGDSYYYRHISRFKIVRRKYTRIQFIPLDELRNLIRYKTLN